MEEPLNGWQALSAVFKDSIVEVLGIVCAGALALCLRLPMTGHDFSTNPYKIATSCIPMIVSLYFNKKTIGCIDDQLRAATLESETRPRAFPVVLIFHTIVTIALWFMQYQTQQHATNIEMVVKLKEDLLEAKKEREMKKKK